MAQSQTTASAGPAGTDRVPDLDDKQLRALTELVYRLIRDQALLEQERRGAGPVRGWR